LITCFGVRNTRLAATASAQVGKNFFNYFFAILSGTLVASAALAADLPPPVVGEDWRTLEARTRPAQLPLVSDTGFEVGLGALDPDNLAAPRPAPAFDLTGVWAFRRYAGADADVHGHFNFLPLPTFTPKGQAFYDEFKRFEAAGRRHLEPTAFCHPAGMPRLQTRVGSLMMLQYPTAIYMVSRLNNEYRTIYLDGRPRIDYAIREPNYLGESIGHWEGDTLVIETEGFIGENHLMQVGVIAGEQLRITERISMINEGNTLMFDYTFVDPEHWVGEWKHVRFHDRILRSDIKEANCLAEDNLALPGMTPYESDAIFLEDMRRIEAGQ
jgi:hypothetical protein